ncbi:hypothetical protein HYN59_17475 [Flavobacterium album]|uniref:Metallo-beta-lactamase domain-containing protein n=1 Tax=Flavobacterium album TaxID=2175091 RepID=A0A2S1R2N2_9FLAO|nr:hypothetical protein [Flavobacterium album]AWH86791.1 hypothetical protein HYN59_17475 [Flavobacterium album]
MNEGFNINPKLIKESELPKLTGESYFAYLDSIEKIMGELHIRFDCINIKDALQVNINNETILNFPSIIIDVRGNYSKLIDKFGTDFIYGMESDWMKIQTNIRETDILQQQFFNFQLIGEEPMGNYDLENITLFENLSEIEQEKIREIVSATQISSTPRKQNKAFLENINLNSFSHVNIYNVGQGNCNALVSGDNIPLLYFDVGGGCNANKKTFPFGFKLCFSNQPKVILSHWDLDHICLAFDINNSDLLNTEWLVPKQRLSNTAIKLATALLRNGNLLCWNNSDNFIDFSNHRIVRCSGNINNKNNSGLALFVHYGNNEYVLLSGDAKFLKIPYHPSKTIIGITASHHGANGSVDGVPYASKPSMLAYSFGLDNTHKHAHCNARRKYVSNNWNHLETIRGSIALKENLITATAPCSGLCTLNISQSY